MKKKILLEGQRAKEMRENELVEINRDIAQGSTFNSKSTKLSPQNIAIEFFALENCCFRKLFRSQKKKIVNIVYKHCIHNIVYICNKMWNSDLAGLRQELKILHMERNKWRIEIQKLQGDVTLLNESNRKLAKQLENQEDTINLVKKNIVL